MPMPIPPTRAAVAPDADLILVGAGLANGLIALRLRELRPRLRVLLLERGDGPGGNHTWSFHPTDLTRAQRDWIAPLVAHRWDAHEVRFPQFARRLAGGYASITSQRFASVLGAAFGPRQLRSGVAVRELTPTAVRLDDGSRLTAHAVIDGRGQRASPQLRLGFQKFLGQELRLAAPHGLEHPVLMDATVAQHGGYRFVYLLPLSADTLLVEDTYYSDGASLDAARLRDNIAAYAQARGWRIDAVPREEHGVLPIVLAGDCAAFWRAADGVPRSGLAAGLFHPTTGYSLPEAVALADLIAGLPDLGAHALFEAIRAHALARWRAGRFFRVLNRMLFQAAPPAGRWRVMQRFYQLPEPLIGRFYAARLTALDRLRIVSGRPPVPLLAALRAALDARPSPPLHLRNP